MGTVPTTPYTYQITRNAGRESLSLVFHSDGQPVDFTEDAPGYHALVQAVRAGADEATIRRLVRPTRVLDSVVDLSDRMRLVDGKLYFDGERIKGRIVKHLRRMASQKDPKLSSLVNFLTKLKSNPSPASQAALYRWLADRDFTLTESGNIVGYKGLTALGMSIHSGTAWVNGIKVVGQIPNPVGAVVTMERDMVNPDRFATCSYGLHVGTWAYASSYAQGMTVTVEVHPADVVMVPDDCGGQKMRVCRYKVISSAVQECRLPVSHDPDDYEPLPDEPAPHEEDDALGGWN